MPAFPTRAALLAALMALACGAQAQTTLTFGGSDALGSILDRQNVRFTACVNDKAAGKLKVNFIQGEQLGSDVQVIEQTMQGSVQIYGDVLDWYANWVKDYAILAWGFTFRDAEHMQKFLDSPTYAAMAEKLRKEQGLRILAAAPTQPRILFSKKPVGSLNDLNGVKMRVPEIKTYLTLWETLGTRPSRLAWGEIYLGLKTGVVEAAEGPISSAYCRQVPRGGAERHPHRPPDVVGAHHHQREGLHGAAGRHAEAGHRLRGRGGAEHAQDGAGGNRGRGAQDGRRRRQGHADRQGADPAARQGRRGQDGEGRRLVAAACGNRSRSCSRHAALAASACSTRIGTVERGLGIALILYMVGAITVQVFTRYALGRPIAWVEESATYAFIWMVLRRRQRRAEAGPPHPHRHLRRAPAAARGRRPARAGLGCWCC